MPSVTFDDITGAVLGSRQPGRTPASPQAHVLGMMTRLGDVAALCGTPDQPISPVERQELQNVVGELAVALCGLGVALDVDVGSAAASVARKRCERANRASDGSTVPSAQRPKRDTLRPNDVASPARLPAHHSASSSAASHRPPPLSSIPTASQPQSVQPSPAAAAAAHAGHADAVAHANSSANGAPNSRQSTAVMGNEAGSLGVSDATASPTTAADARYQQYQPPRSHHNDSSEGEERAKWGAAQSPPRAAPQQQQQQQQQQDAGLMSPKTTRSFFPELDRIAALYEQGRLSEAVYDDLHLVWSVIDDHGEVIELIPRGCTKPVAYAEFPSYVRMAEYLRHGSPARNNTNAAANAHAAQPQQYSTPPQQQKQRDEESASGGLLSPHAGPAQAPTFGQLPQHQQQQPQTQAASPAAVAPPGFIIKRIPVENHGENARGHFSPDHFKGGMFSPAQPQQYVDVAYPADEGAPAGLTSPPGPRGRAVGPDVQAPTAVRPAAGAATLPLSQVEADHDGSPMAAGGPPPQAAGRPLTKKEEDAFWRKVAIIEAREATGNGIAALELTLTMPKHGRLEPLTTNGEYLPVTAANAQDFLNLLQEQRALMSGKLRRMDSVKTLAMPQPPSFNFKKETRQYGHDRRTGSDDQMLAPAPPPRTIFYVDFDEHAIGEVEPPALKRRAIPQQLPSSAHYLDLIMSSPESFKDIYAAATRDPTLIQRLQVTFCVPDPDALLSPHMVASLPAGARPRCGLRDLVANGRNTRVGRDDWEKYSKLVLEASQSLPPSVAVHGPRK